MADFTLYPKNDFAKFAKLKDINPSSGAVLPLTSGTVTVFLSTGKLPTSVAADPSLSMNAIHVGSGKWLIFFDASVLTPSLLETHFASTAPILIVEQPNGVRVYFEGEYLASRPGTVA